MTARPEPPIESNTLKQILRAGLDTQISRSYWWPVLPSLKPEENNVIEVDTVKEVVESAERLPGILGADLGKLLDFRQILVNPKEKENETIENTARRLSSVLISQTKVAEIDISYWMPLVKIISWQVKRVDICYWMLDTVIQQPDRYFAPSPGGLHVMFYTFREMLRSFMPKTYTVLKTIGALEDKYLSVLFVDFFVEIFPPHILLPLLDAYFLEGVKILYRYALALIAGYKGNIKAGRYSTAKEFWLAVKADGVAVAQAANTSMCNKLLGIDEVMQQADAFLVNERARNQTYFLSGKLKENAYDVGRSIFAKISKPMNVSRANIKVLERAASLVEDKDVVRKSVSRRMSASLGNNSPMNNSTKTLTEKFMESPENKPLSRVKSGSVSIKNRTGSLSPAGSSSNPSAVNSPISPQTLDSVPTSSSGAPMLSSRNFTDVTDLQINIDSLAEQSEIMDRLKAEKLLSCLPETVAIGGLDLCFATYKNGWDISTLYHFTTGLSPVVFVFKLQVPFDEVIIGAITSGTISPPNQGIVRGDGKTSRIFKIDNTDNTIMFEAQVHQNGEVLDGAKQAALTQYCMARLESLSFGASFEHGTNALRVENDLKALFLGPSDTYGNSQPLMYNMLSQSTDSQDEGGIDSANAFELQEIEIYCGRTSKHTADKEGRFTERQSVLG